MALYLNSLQRNARELLFWEYTGTVLSSEKRNEVHTSTYRRNRRLVRHTSTLNHEFWIKTTSGYEFPVHLKNQDIPLREGQAVSLIYAGYEGSQHTHLCALVNHSARHHWFFYPVKKLARILYPERQVGKGLGMAFSACLLFLLIMVLLTSQIFLPLALTTLFGIFAMFVAILRDSIQLAPIKRALRRDVVAHIEDLAVSMYARNEIPN